MPGSVATIRLVSSCMDRMIRKCHMRPQNGARWLSSSLKRIERERVDDGGCEAQGFRAEMKIDSSKDIKARQKSKSILRVLLIRHAESVNNRLYQELCDTGRHNYWDYDRLPDPPLTEKGWVQAEELAMRLERNPELYDFDGRQLGIQRIYTSAMYRALQTSSPMHRHMRIPTEVWPDIHETGGIFHINEGMLRGLTHDQVAVEFAGYEIPRGTVRDNGWWRGGAETYEQMLARTHSTKRRLIKMAGELDDDMTIAMVSHGSFLSALIRALTQAKCSFALLNTSISCIDIQAMRSEYEDIDEAEGDRARIRVHYFNCLDNGRAKT
eukprot:CAMPEP_0184501746 /NCGR_PEP_ID=MMETSP0113_2-20130426/48465_1 /TAXON_ID=91329 /ORGANISM="Norrisiella sphaerica, Strain BC52" /LENGTH=324 /DNA_ID=CAMNT_0026890621 /DNA_START=36 /DNA_END=1010 /DNA_ORIENTATION=-